MTTGTVSLADQENATIFEESVLKLFDSTIDQIIKQNARLLMNNIDIT